LFSIWLCLFCIGWGPRPPLKFIKPIPNHPKTTQNHPKSIPKQRQHNPQTTPKTIPKPRPNNVQSTLPQLHQKLNGGPFLLISISVHKIDTAICLASGAGYNRSGDIFSCRLRKYAKVQCRKCWFWTSPESDLFIFFIFVFILSFFFEKCIHIRSLLVSMYDLCLYSL